MQKYGWVSKKNFKKNYTILSKKDPNNCTIKDLNQ